MRQVREGRPILGGTQAGQKYYGGTRARQLANWGWASLSTSGSQSKAMPVAMMRCRPSRSMKRIMVVRLGLHIVGWRGAFFQQLEPIAPTLLFKGQGSDAMWQTPIVPEWLC